MTRPYAKSRNNIQVFVDLDGVLADFDNGYRQMISSTFEGTGVGAVDWEAVRNCRGFFEQLPTMPDFEILWNCLEPFDPTILTGVPSDVPTAEADNRAWVTNHIGTHARLITCRSPDKCIYGKRGDVLIDDWERHMDLWVEMGGYWITHRSARESIRLLSEYMDKLHTPPPGQG